MANAITENILNPKQAIQDAQETVAETAQNIREVLDDRVQVTKDLGIDRGLGVVESSLKLTKRWATATNLTTPAKRIQKALSDVRAKRRENLQPAVEDYDALTAKEIISLLTELDRTELKKARRYEEANKNRKTVLGAIEKRLA